MTISEAQRREAIETYRAWLLDFKMKNDMIVPANETTAVAIWKLATETVIHLVT